MIWVIAFFIIILISSVLAYRSMKDYEEFPDSLSLNALFYISNPQFLNSEILDKLHRTYLGQKHFFSLELLIRGKEKAKVIYGPRDLVTNFPELNLIELEDYIEDAGNMILGENSEKKTNVNQTLSWLIEPKNNAKKQLQVLDELRNLEIGEKQKVFLQAVLMPVDKGGFQTTLRIMVADSDPISKVELAKSVNQIFEKATGLKKHEDEFPETKKFDSFKQRSLVPKEVAEFNLSSEEILSLIGT